MSRCVTCRRPCSDGYLCWACTTTFDRTLGLIPDLTEQLALTITRQTKLGASSGNKQRKQNEQPMPYNLNASEAFEVLKLTLVAWVREIQPAVSSQPRDDVISIGVWLHQHLDAIRQHKAADTLTDEITDAVTQGWAAVDRPANRSRVKVAACIDPTCDGQLWARIPTADYVEHDLSTHATIRCDTCDETYSASQWLNLGRRIMRSSA